MSDPDELRYREWAQLLGVASPGDDPADALAGYFLETFRNKGFGPLFDRVRRERELVRTAIVSAMSTISFWARRDQSRPVSLEALTSEVGWNLFYENLLLGFLDAERAYRVSLVEKLRTAVACRCDGVTPVDDGSTVELETRLRAAESDLENWDTLNRDDFQLDDAGEFLEGRTERGKAALKRP